MPVICCYTDLKDRTEAALRQHAPDAEFIPVHGIYDYNAAVAAHWGSGEPLVVVEHDIVIDHRVLPAFAACTRPWCVYGYDSFPEPLTRRIVTGLGCTKFSAKAQAAFGPGEFLVADDAWWERCPDCAGRGCWRYLDARIENCMRRRGWSPHVHGTVEHLHKYEPGWCPFQ